MRTRAREEEKREAPLPSPSRRRHKFHCLHHFLHHHRAQPCHAVAPRENACEKREDATEDSVAVRSVAPPVRTRREKETPSTTVSPPESCHYRKPPPFWLPEAVAVLATGSHCRAFAFLVASGPPEFLAAVGAAAGSVRDCSWSVLLLSIELSGLPVAIKAVSAIAEVNRPVVEAVIDFGMRENVLVTHQVYGFNFSR
ncbi:uncharacterized protein DS421_18g614490 [Arachis hypogaea]|nr:uncharacterized protein DS421_18g614490 [Arachis hypogaea]